MVAMVVGSRAKPATNGGRMWLSVMARRERQWPRRPTAGGKGGNRSESARAVAAAWQGSCRSRERKREEKEESEKKRRKEKGKKKKKRKRKKKEEKIGKKYKKKENSGLLIFQSFWREKLLGHAFRGCGTHTEEAREANSR